MNEYILRGERDSVVLSAEAIRRLLRSGNGDAALCYLAVAAKITDGVNLSPERVEKAFAALTAMELVSKRDGTATPPTVHRPVEQEAPRPEYTNADLLRALEGGEFRGLSAAVDNALGKKLTTPDQKLLLGLYDDLGLSADVIFLLVNYCIERSAALYGPGRKPTIRQIEREGYSWARMGLMDEQPPRGSAEDDAPSGSGRTPPLRQRGEVSLRMDRHGFRGRRHRTGAGQDHAQMQGAEVALHE